jgi:hypothetical protein
MPQVRFRDGSGVLRTAARIRMRDASNVLRNIQRIHMRDPSGVLRTVWQYFSVTLDYSTITGSNDGPAGNGTVTTASVTGTVVGGTAGFTYLWEYIDGDATIIPATPTAAATTFSATHVPDAIPKMKAHIGFV